MIGVKYKTETEWPFGWYEPKEDSIQAKTYKFSGRALKHQVKDNFTNKNVNCL